jgi:serine/threonine-protein kinase
MSVSLLERLKVALADHYEIERELGTGGMGTVFLARDVTLERSVAIKMLRPELATAVAAERFVREARILAKLSHPNVVPIHDAGEVDGLFYYVMDCIQGETLDERLERGPLQEDDVVRLGRDLLAALEAAHGTGVIQPEGTDHARSAARHARLHGAGTDRRTGHATHGPLRSGHGAVRGGYREALVRAEANR